MNYDHLNQTYDYWAEKIRPHLTARMQVASFEDYLKKFTFTKSGRWIRDAECVRFTRPPAAIDPELFVKKYSDNCVAIIPPMHPTEGLGRVIFQLSPTLHLESMTTAWVENNELQSYLSMFVCHKTDAEMTELLEVLSTMRRTGNTEERTGAGFRPGAMGGFPFAGVQQ